MHRYNWTGTMNTRELGGTPTTDGGQIRFQRFIRSNAPCKITAGVKDFLLERNVKIVIDLHVALSGIFLTLKSTDLHLLV